MITLEGLHSLYLDLDARLRASEQRQVRFMRYWIASHLNSPTSTPTTAPSTSMVPTAASPTTDPASTRLSRGSLLRHAGQHLPRLAGWLAEKAIQYLWPVLASAAMASWAIVRRYGEAIAEWLSGWWHWLGL